jgi:hypothetical protein
LKISVTTPVKNEFPWIGYSIMAALPFVHEFIYNVASDSDDGTIALLTHLKTKLGDKLKFTISNAYAFDPHDQKAYNQSFNDAIDESTGDACWFLHPDMIVMQGKSLLKGPLAWWTNVTSFAGDLQTQITQGRVTRWKNIHVKKFGLHYFGGYGSTNEDFYHRDVTGNAYKHYGTEFSKYPYPVADSGFSINHYCEVKSYSRRLEKMRLCIRTQNPHFDERLIDEMAANHPRVTLESADKRFGNFEFKKVDVPIPDVIKKYKEEFESIGRLALV